VDEFELPRGHHYGTMLINLTNGHRQVDVPGARDGAPERCRSAERWHLWDNPCRDVERLVAAHHPCLPAVDRRSGAVDDDPATTTVGSSPAATHRSRMSRSDTISMNRSPSPHTGLATVGL